MVTGTFGYGTPILFCSYFFISNLKFLPDTASLSIISVCVSLSSASNLSFSAFASSYSYYNLFNISITSYNDAFFSANVSSAFYNYAYASANYFYLGSTINNESYVYTIAF